MSSFLFLLILFVQFWYWVDLIVYIIIIYLIFLCLILLLIYTVILHTKNVHSTFF